MNFEEAMTKHKGTWEGDTALIKDRGYTFKVAKKTDAGIELLFDAKRFVSTDAAPQINVEVPKRGLRGKKAAPAEPVAVESAAATDEGE